MEETCNQKVVSSNPGAGYWMDIFHIHICCKICNNCFEKMKINKKEAKVGPFFFKKKNFLAYVKRKWK